MRRFCQEENLLPCVTGKDKLMLHTQILRPPAITNAKGLRCPQTNGFLIILNERRIGLDLAVISDLILMLLLAVFFLAGKNRKLFSQLSPRILSRIRAVRVSD